MTFKGHTAHNPQSVVTSVVLLILARGHGIVHWGFIDLLKPICGLLIQPANHSIVWYQFILNCFLFFFHSKQIYLKKNIDFSMKHFDFHIMICPSAVGMISLTPCSPIPIFLTKTCQKVVPLPELEWHLVDLFGSVWIQIICFLYNVFSVKEQIIWTKCRCLEIFNARAWQELASKSFIQLCTK